MESNFGGPVWHASGRGLRESDSWTIAEHAIRAVGDASLGEWRAPGTAGSGVVHLRRRLTAEEAATYGHVVRDIRGSDEEQVRLARVYAELADVGLLR